MTIFREISIQWKDESYSLTPSNRLLRRIEGEGISFPRLIQGVSDGAPAVAEICFVVSEFLRASGAEVSEDEVYDAAMTDLADGDGEAFARLALMVVEAIAPKGLDEKKPKGQSPQSAEVKSPAG